MLRLKTKKTMLMIEIDFVNEVHISWICSKIQSDCQKTYWKLKWW